MPIVLLMGAVIAGLEGGDAAADFTAWAEGLLREMDASDVEQ